MPAHLLLVSGSTRTGSTNTAALRTIAAHTNSRYVATVYDGLSALPAFSPDFDDESLPDIVIELRRAIAEADAVLVCTPEYAGGLPGSFKNLLDWTIGGGELYGKPVGWVNVSSVAAPMGGAQAHASLATVLHYAGADVVDDACVRLPLSRDLVGPDGLISDPGTAARLRAVAMRLADSKTNEQGRKS